MPSSKDIPIFKKSIQDLSLAHAGLAKGETMAPGQ